jgi:hypothetical protein
VKVHKRETMAVHIAQIRKSDTYLNGRKSDILFRSFSLNLKNIQNKFFSEKKKFLGKIKNKLVAKQHA